MYEKQQNFNTAYNSPSVLSFGAYNRGGRGGKLLLTVLTIVGIGIFLLWLIVRPNVAKFDVTDASLTEFNYTAANNTLLYDLAVKITVRNPNCWISVHHNHIEATAVYQGARFDTYSFDRLYQDPKTTSVLRHVFKGQHVVVLGAEQKKKLNKEKSKGVYGIDVKMRLKVRFQLGRYKTMTLKPKVTCHLHVPFKLDGGGSGGSSNFRVTKCGWNR